MTVTSCSESLPTQGGRTMGIVQLAVDDIAAVETVSIG